MKQIFDSLKKQSPSRIIALGWSSTINDAIFLEKRSAFIFFECVIYINECCLRYWTCCR